MTENTNKDIKDKDIVETGIHINGYSLVLKKNPLFNIPEDLDSDSESIETLSYIIRDSVLKTLSNLEKEADGVVCSEVNLSASNELLN